MADDEALIARGLAGLVGVLDSTGQGMTVVGPDRGYVYVNPAACRILGRSLGQLLGHNFLDAFDEVDQTRIVAQLPKHVGEATAPIFCVLHDGDGGQRDVLCATFALDKPAESYVVVILRDLTPPGVAARTANALAQSAHVIGTGTTEDILVGIARLAVDNTRALACGITILGEERKLSMGGGYGFASGERRRSAWRTGVITLEDLPGGSALLGHEPVFLPTARTTYEASPVLRPFTAALAGADWQGAAYVPLTWDEALVGFLGVFLPTGVTAPSSAELAFFSALADQAAVVVINSRLAAATERTRLAHELHDSVSQALFSMTMHARAAQLALVKDGLDETTPLARSITQLVELTRSALAEMRALIFELRPAALAEEGLVAALRKQAAALTAREAVAITVQGPEQRLQLVAAVEEHLYRIVSEALHNVVKHARASEVMVSIVDQTGVLRVMVSDDGTGFDPTIKHPGHLGLATMSQRADAAGAELVVTSESGSGTVVTLTLAHRPPD
ncbi:MAG: putative two-component system sensor kinase [Pseudonocardiales bacterium]|nr:putative two-component system sensor kinase [Pseudonocardiales bacterium]